MKNRKRKPGVFKRLAGLYDRMVEQYAAVAGKAGFTCSGCEQNCCVSYFQHHTYIEWSYLWRGMLELPETRRQHFLEKAQRNVADCNYALSQGMRPRAMCPLNEDGLCQLYAHRLMICRLHGVAHLAPKADGSTEAFPGCYRFENAIEGRDKQAEGLIMDRGALYRELAALEMEFLKDKLGPNAQRPPRVQFTLSQMLVEGPPRF